MANCSKDAKIEEVKMEAIVNGEKFQAKGVKIKEKNFLEIYS